MINLDYPLDYTKGPEQRGADRRREADLGTSGTVKNVTGSADGLAGSVSKQAREYADKAQDAAESVKPLFEKVMKEQPMAVLGVAAALGLVIGACWKR
jgi:ElaB/YqjD/DUF883 family membrane-anchored ribosome-binding protein